MSDDDRIDDVPVVRARRSFFERVSLVWLIPVAALVVALGIAWQTFAERGPAIEIFFRNAAGIQAGETQLRYRDVVVGTVEEVAFASGLEQVRVTVRLNKEVADYVDEDSQFWVVRPEVTTQGVTGLETVLSGVYLAGQWDNVQGNAARTFTGNEQPPLNEGDEDGVTIFLRTSGTSLTGNAPLLYKGVEVGRIGPARVSDDGMTVEAQAFVQAPYDNLVTESTRFWDSSGFSFTLGSAGAALNFDSIASLIAGGVSFDTFVSGGTLAEQGDTFDVYTDRSSARASVFNRRDGVELTLAAVFEQDVTGLAPGAPVELEGLRIGEVTGLNGIADGDNFGEAAVRLQVVFSIQPARLGFDGEGSESQALEFFAQQVGQGLRARLATANLLTGGLKLELVKPDGLEPGLLVERPGEYPVLPTAPGDLIDVGATAEGTLARIDALPIEELLEAAVSFLDSASSLVGSEDIKQVPTELAGLLGNLRGVTGSSEVQALPGQIAAVMTDLQASLEDVSGLLAELEEQQAAARVLAAVDSVSSAAAGLESSAEGVPELIEQITGLAEDARALGLAELGQRANELVASAQALVGGEAVQAIPADVSAALGEVTDAAASAGQLIDTLNDNQTAERLAAAADSAAAALEAARPGLEGIPPLVDELTAVAQEARAMGLPALGQRAGELVASAQTLIGGETAQALPGEISAALSGVSDAVSEVEQLIAGLNENETAARISEAADAAAQALTSAQPGLEGISPLVDELTALAQDARNMALPALSAQASQLVTSAQSLIGGETTQAIPGQVSAALEELTAATTNANEIIGTLTEADVAAQLSNAIDTAASALSSIETSSAELPQLVDDARALVARANSLPLETFGAEAERFASAAADLVASEQAQALPGQLNSALGELSAALEELRDGGAIENTNAALDSARAAADAIAAASNDLPALIARADALTNTASTVLQGYDSESPALREARSALREISRAAQAVSQLARAIERQPNSLILGR
ncbi:MlaD family protein [Pseudoroseicyclus sp. H15]